MSRLAEHDVNQYNSSSNSRKEKKPNNLEQSGSRYDGSLHKNNFGEYTDLGKRVTNFEVFKSPGLVRNSIICYNCSFR